MSNPTEILVEKLELRRLLYERVFVKWEDESGTSCTLGSRLYTNKQNLQFFLAVYSDTEGHLHIHFPLKVSIKVAGIKQEIEILLVVPPDADFPDPSKPHLMSTIDELSYLDASAIYDAQLSDSVYVFRIQFDLISNGFIIMKKKKNTIIQPFNTTSKILIDGLESLSRAKTFTVYIKPSDYALVGIQELRNRFSKTGGPTDPYKPSMKETYIRCVPELVEWSSEQISLPPVYTENRQLIPEVQVPRSPPVIFEKQMPSINTIEAAIAETPARTPTSSNSTSVHAIVPPSYEETPTQARTPTSHDSTSVHGIFSPSREESPASQVSLNDIEEPSRCMENFDVDSDEEQLAKEQFAKLDSRAPNQQQIDHPLEVSEMLNSKCLKWFQTVVRINANFQAHKRLTTKLSTLFACIRASNTTAFDTTLLWCSALFFYDPLDSDPDNILGLWEKRNTWLISDIAKLIQWANGIYYGAEISPSLLNHFLELGNTARVVALDTRHNRDKYYDQKCICIFYTLMEFSKPGVSEENSKSVSGKGLGTDSNASKRLKM
ncbi:hypothetical protein BOTCAL_0078g00200 [Botryotinia calthae]|uniref:Uncharacterized protein n=1 Tax=Botryotinia calthae TaxID=38488 RepID=A0A4Y8DAL6_9HELO|nr:hypothetical protein BOTCAL_0078g00200 [Botryotinia calthae]